jgi:hypothetical protein
MWSRCAREGGVRHLHPQYFLRQRRASVVAASRLQSDRVGSCQVAKISFPECSLAVPRLFAQGDLNMILPGRFPGQMRTLLQ